MTTRPPTEKKPTPIPPRVGATCCSLPVVAFPHYPPSPTLHHRAGSRTALHLPLSSRMRGPIPFPPPPVQRRLRAFAQPIHPSHCSDSPRAFLSSRRGWFQTSPCSSLPTTHLAGALHFPFPRRGDPRRRPSHPNRATHLPRRAGSRTVLPNPLSSRMRGPIPFPHLPFSRPSSSPSAHHPSPLPFFPRRACPREDSGRESIPFPLFRRGVPHRRPLHSTVRPTSPVATVREPPFPIRCPRGCGDPSPSPTSVGASLIVARYIQPCGQPPCRGGSRSLFHKSSPMIYHQVC